MTRRDLITGGWRDRLGWPASGRALLALAAGAWLIMLALAAGARAQPAPPPLFRVEPIGALCGAAEDHLRVMRDNGFEPAWRGDGGRGGGAFLVINDEGFWILLLVFPERPDEACVVADGPSFSYAPAPH